MALPKNAVPTYELTLPTSKQKIKYRPFLVGEQKVVMMAKEGSSGSIMSALRQIVDRCTFGKLDIDSMPDFDVEWLFLQMRIHSTGAHVEMVVTCQHCEATHDYVMDLKSVEMYIDPSHTKKIILSPGYGVEMEYPTSEQMDKLRSDDSEVARFEIIKSCLRSVFTEDEVYPTADESDEEIESWIEGLTDQQFGNIENFFATMPSVRHEFIETCPHCEKRTKYVLEGVDSFFV